MQTVKGYAAAQAGAPLQPFEFERRDADSQDVVLDILYCGICHTDVHQTKNEWGGSHFPMVPGHEIVGRISRIGAKVKRFKPGDIGGVGCFVDSCRECAACRHGDQHFCDQVSWTYNSKTKDGGVTYGGYSAQIIVDENYVLKIPPKLPLERVAPLLCAGITTYSPLRHWKVTKGQDVGVVGLGGLGHMAVKLADSMGADVTVFSTSKTKEADAKRLGASHFVLGSDASPLAALKNRFDFILDTVSAPHAINPYLELLHADGAMVLVGVPPAALEVHPFSLIVRRRHLGGSLIGGLSETQEMLDYCADKKILADVELLPINKVNEAYERILKSDVRYRFVIDMKTL